MDDPRAPVGGDEFSEDDLSENDIPDNCESCGWADTELKAVHRIYAAVENERVVGGTASDEIEWWCSACRAMYPHISASEA